MSLSDIELRILGALVEKERTTPEAYPLSSNALVAACNQKTSRDPVSDYGLLEVEEAMRRLADRGLARTGREPGERVAKHRHALADAYGLGARQLAVLAVLILRGPQTAGELRTRTERYVDFADPEQVEAVLENLAERSPPLVRNRGRGPGQSQDRWQHTLGADPEQLRPRVRLPGEGSRPVRNAEPAGAGSADDSGGADDAGVRARLTALERQVAELRRALRSLQRELGLEPPAGDAAGDDDPASA